MNSCSGIERVLSESDVIGFPAVLGEALLRLVELCNKIPFCFAPPNIIKSSPTNFLYSLGSIP